jgi:transcriptional regulator GlxA family with amidase domain
MLSVTVLEIPGAMPSSVAITHDVLATANRISVGAKRATPFVVNAVPCGSAPGRARTRRADLLIVPGLGTAEAGDLELKLRSTACHRAQSLLAEAFTGGAAVAASCASTFLLAEAGLLKGRQATTTWWLAPTFRRRYPEIDLVTDRIVVDDWPVATAGAALAQMDLMLAIVTHFAGAGLARACANYLLLDERQSQAPFMAIGYLARQDPKVAKAENWIRKNIARDFTVNELADSVALAPRTFARRISTVCGVTPIQFVQRIRIETACYLLETTRLPVEEIARNVGYAEASTLRRLMRRDRRHSPAHYRRAA